jgi:type II secretion system protein N
MKERIKKILPYVAYPLAYLFFLALFALVTFPFDKLKERFVGSFNAQQRATNGNQELQIEEMSGYWLTGVKMKNVKIVSLPTEPNKPMSEIKIEEARARISFLPLLIGNQNVSFTLKAFDGEVEGGFQKSGKDRAVDLHFEGLDVGKLDPLVQAVGLPMEGRLTGDIKLTMPEGKASKGNGTIELKIADVAVGDGKAKIKNMFALPRMSVGEVVLSAEAKDGSIKVSKLNAGGKDLELQGEGRIQMKEMATDSLVDLSLRFKVNDNYKNKNNDTKALFGGGGIPPAIELDPKVKQSKRPDGFYAWNARGPLGRLDFQPATTGTVPANPFQMQMNK